MKVFNGWRRILLCLPIVIFVPHILSVLELQRHPTVLHSGKTNKFDHLVLGPAAGEGLSNRLQCQGTKALNRTSFSKYSSSSSYGDSVSFVTVFATYNSTVDKQVNGRSLDSVTVGKNTYNKVERSLAVLNVFIDFIQMTMPRSDVIILTDPSSELPVDRDRVIVHPVPGEYSRDKLMLQRIRSYIA